MDDTRTSSDIWIIGKIGHKFSSQKIATLINWRVEKGLQSQFFWAILISVIIIKPVNRGLINGLQ
jgi:hypothetical protein